MQSGSTGCSLSRVIENIKKVDDIFSDTIHFLHYFLPEVSQHPHEPCFFAHAFAWGQPMQQTPRFFSRMR